MTGTIIVFGRLGKPGAIDKNKRIRNHIRIGKGMIGLRHVTRRQAVSLAGTAVTAWAAAPALARRGGSDAQVSPPNIIYIMADDLGYADLGCYGNTYKTPHIDTLARDGIKLTQAYANSCVCTATRAGLVTGRYQNRFRVGQEEPLGFNSPEIGLDPATPTMPRYMKQLGYRTVLVGKWHLGDPPKFGPLKSGYERFFGIYGGGKDYLLSPDPTANNTLHDGDKQVIDHRYMTDELGDRAVREVEEAARDGQPLFLSLHFTAPHWPWEGPEDMAVAKNLSSIFHYDGGNIATFQKMLTSLDDNVGKVLRALQRSGQARNTIVVFTSDNGGERFSNTWPLTGMKGELLEGGIRVPVLVRWPGFIRKGATSAQVAISMDWMPTFLAAGGAPEGFDAPSDGINILPALRGAGVQSRRLFWMFKANGQAAVRDGDWKYLRIAEREYLFDLSYDERERANRATAAPDRFKAMKQMHADWTATMLPYPADNTSHNVRGTLPDLF